MKLEAPHSVFIRSLEPEDKERWSELWQGYLTFYETELTDEQSELTWQRLLSPNYNSYALVAELDGEVVGLTHYSFQTSTWAQTGYCYLEDLFTDPNFRGKGIGRSLIESVKEIAIANKCSRLYWNTDESNQTARALYDTFSPVSSKRQYRIAL